jgi:hypothetical protein
MARPSMHRGDPRASSSISLSAALLGSALAASLAGCAQLLGIDEVKQGADAGPPGGIDAAPPESCDADLDGYYLDHPACDLVRAGAPVDCDDTREDIHPNAPTVCGDAVINNCVTLPPDVQASFGIQEIGLLSADPIYVGDVDGFHNNVSVAAAFELDRLALMTTASESATTVRIVRVDYDEPLSAQILTPALPSGVRPANHPVEVVRMPDSFRIGTLGLATPPTGGIEVYRPMFGVIDANAADAVSFAVVEPGNNCPIRGEPEDTVPFTLSGMTEAGGMYFEVSSTDTLTQRVFYAAPEGVTCRSPVDLGISFSEFGSQIVASGDLAAGTSEGGSWFWFAPLNYDFLSLYTPANPRTGGATLLARNVTAGEPVLYAFQSGDSGMAIEATTCLGSEGCTAENQNMLFSDAPLHPRGLSLAPLGTGALLVSGHQAEGFEGPTRLDLRFLDAIGNVLGVDFAYTATVIGGPDAVAESLRTLDVATVAPTAARPWHDIAIAAAVQRLATNQPELRLLRVRACNSQ